MVELKSFPALVIVHRDRVGTECLLYLHYYSGETRNKPEKVGTTLCCGRRTWLVIPSSNQTDNIRDESIECSTMDGSMTINGSVSNAGVTIFSSEACEAVEAIGDFMPMSLAIAQPDIQDIKAYFERPRLVVRGSVPFGSTSTLYDLPIDNLNTQLKAYFPQWSQRLAGAFGIRFTMNFRLQVAATAFHQGILAMSYQYAFVDGTFNRSGKSFAVTNLPHVRLDIAESTMVELKVPFLYPNEFLEVEPVVCPTNFNHGGISITPILPLVSVTGITAPTYDLYVYLSDIELYGVDVVNPSTVTLQSGGGLITKEVKDSRIVSKSLSNMATISRFVSRGIPSLAAVAGPAAWALDTAAGVAKYFGFSKPMVQDPPMKVYRSNYGNEYQVDVPQTGDVVGIIQENTTTIDTSLGGTDVDEMALAFIASQWSQCARLQITTSNTHGLAIYSAAVSPSTFWFRAGTTTPFSNIGYPTSSADLTSQSGNCFMPTSLMYISSFFRYWRGSIKFRFTFAKTKLHGGRYMVTFNPSTIFQTNQGGFGSAVKGPEIVGGLQQPYGNSMIMDLKDTNVFEFTCPFVSQTPYRSFNSAIGGITIVCIDPLQATATVTPTVPMLVEVCGGEDYELADFSGVYFPISTQGTIYTQSGGSVRVTTKPPSSNTIGERITSAKQMIQVPSPEVFTVTVGTSGKTFIVPWFVNPTHNDVVSLAGLPNGVTGTQTFRGGNNVGQALAKCYAFVKGGTNYHVYPNSNKVNIKLFQAASPAGANDQARADLASQAFPSSVPTVFQTSGLATHARLPSFQPLVRIPSCALDTYFFSTSDQTVANAGVLGHLYCVTYTNEEAASVEVIVGRSASDDAQMAHYMGPVPIFIPNASSVNPIDNTTYSS